MSRFWLSPTRLFTFWHRAYAMTHPNQLARLSDAATAGEWEAELGPHDSGTFARGPVIQAQYDHSGVMSCADAAYIAELSNAYRAGQLITPDARDARISKLEAALTNIMLEAERENGKWVHLKRVIGVQARAALATATPHTPA